MWSAPIVCKKEKLMQKSVKKSLHFLASDAKIPNCVVDFPAKAGGENFVEEVFGSEFEIIEFMCNNIK